MLLLGLQPAALRPLAGFFVPRWGECSTPSQRIWQMPQREAQVAVWPTLLTPCVKDGEPGLPRPSRATSGPRDMLVSWAEPVCLPARPARAGVGR